MTDESSDIQSVSQSQVVTKHNESLWTNKNIVPRSPLGEQVKGAMKLTMKFVLDT